MGFKSSLYNWIMVWLLIAMWVAIGVFFLTTNKIRRDVIRDLEQIRSEYEATLGVLNEDTF